MVQESELRDLRHWIDTLEEQVDFLLNHFGLTFYPKPDMDDSRIVLLLQEGKIIEAIKKYREFYPRSELADAKRAVEEIKMRHGY